MKSSSRWRAKSAAWGDYDSDGDLDLALAGDTGSGYTGRIYREDAGAFTDIVAARAIRTPSSWKPLRSSAYFKPAVTRPTTEPLVLQGLPVRHQTGTPLAVQIGPWRTAS